MKNLFRYASLLLAAAMLFASCGEKDNPDPNGTGGGNDPSGNTPSGEIRITFDKDVIQANGTDATTLKVMVGDTDVTSDSEIYDENNNPVTLNGGKFTASKSGSYKFWALYGTLKTYDKSKTDNGLITIKAIPVPVPAPAKDDTPEKTTFTRRVFIAQSTGTACKYCPGMVMIMRKVFDPAKMVLAAVHNFAAGDPAYLAQPSYGSLGASGVPSVTVDFASVFGDYTSQSGLKKTIDDRYEAVDAKVGISVNSVLKDGYLVARVTVKAAETGTYNVGAWLLEDDIFGKQADEYGIKKQDPDHDYDRHDNCVRIADSNWEGSYIGFPLGEIKKGETASKTFVMQIKEEYVVENLHMAVFVTEASDERPGHRVNGKYYTMNNAIDCDINKEVGFDYK